MNRKITYFLLLLSFHIPIVCNDDNADKPSQGTIEIIKDTLRKKTEARKKNGLAIAEVAKEAEDQSGIDLADLIKLAKKMEGIKVD